MDQNCSQRFQSKNFHRNSQSFLGLCAPRTNLKHAVRNLKPEAFEGNSLRSVGCCFPTVLLVCHHLHGTGVPVPRVHIFFFGLLFQNKILSRNSPRRRSEADDGSFADEVMEGSAPRERLLDRNSACRRLGEERMQCNKVPWALWWWLAIWMESWATWPVV